MPPDRRFWVSVDLGQIQDPSALTVLEDTPTHGPLAGKPLRSYAVRHIRRWTLGTSYTNIVDDVTQTLQRPPLLESRCVLVLDATGVGRAVVDMFRKVKLRCRLEAVTITGAQALGAHHDKKYGWRVPKKDLVGVLQTLLGHHRLKVANLPERNTLLQELRTFKVKVKPTTGNETLESWRERDHDDVVLSLAIGLWIAERYWRDRLLLALPFGTGKKAALHLVCCTHEELARLEIDPAHRCVLINLQDHASYNSEGGVQGESAVVNAGASAPLLPSSFNFTLLESLTLTFAPLDPVLFQASWQEPVPGYNRPPADLIMSRHDGVKLWGLLTRQRGGPSPDVIIVAGGQDGRALSLCLALADCLQQPRSVIYRPALPEADTLTNTMPPLRHVYEMVKVTRGSSW